MITTIDHILKTHKDDLASQCRELVRLLTTTTYGHLTKLEDFTFAYHLVNVFPKWDKQFEVYIDAYLSKCNTGTPRDTISLGIKYLQVNSRNEFLAMPNIIKMCIILVDKLESLAYLYNMMGQLEIEPDSVLAFVGGSNLPNVEWIDKLKEMCEGKAGLQSKQFLFKSIPLLQNCVWKSLETSSDKYIQLFISKCLTRSGLCFILDFDGSVFPERSLKHFASIVDGAYGGKFLEAIATEVSDTILQIVLWYAYCIGLGDHERLVNGAKMIFGMEKLRRHLEAGITFTLIGHPLCVNGTEFQWKETTRILDLINAKPTPIEQQVIKVEKQVLLKTQDLINLLQTKDLNLFRTSPPALTQEEFFKSFKELAKERLDDTSFIHNLVKMFVNSDGTDEEIIRKLHGVVDKLAENDGLVMEIRDLARRGIYVADLSHKLAYEMNK
jgi:hypothetical protein